MGVMSLAFYGSRGDASSLALTAVGLACSLVTIVYWVTLYCVFTRSPFLFVGRLLLWDQQSIIMAVSSFPVTFGLGGAFQTNGFRWQTMISPALLVVFVVVVLRRVFYFPVAGAACNAIAAAVLVAAGAGAIIAILQTVAVIVTFAVHFAVVGTAYVVGWITFWLVFRAVRGRMKGTLTYTVTFPRIAYVTEENKLNYIKSLGISDSDTGMAYLRVGFEEACDLFLDWSLARYLSTTFKDCDDLMMFLTMIVSFFPSETTLLRNLTICGSRMTSMSLMNCALHYQLHRAHIFR